MNKTVKIILIVILLGALGAVMIYFGKKNSKEAQEFTTKQAFTTTIEKKSVATGKVIPEDEIAIKPQISGIIDKIFVEEGSFVKAGDLIAKIKVVPNEKNLYSALGRLKNAKIQLNNTEIEYNRNKKLFDKGVIASQDFNTIELRFQKAQQELENAENDYQIIKVGSTSGSSSTNTNITATVSGTILEIPVKEGYQVIESNNFNAGTTIASIADLNKMIFEGKVDEVEVGKLKENTVLEVTIGAIEGKKFKANLDFIAPKGVNEQGAVLFIIKASLELDKTYVRAGYSANAELILDKKEDILAIKESLIQYDRKSEEPYVEIETGEQQFERKEIKLGISDGINVEIISGISAEDKIKVWNKASKDDNDDKKDK
ncbi:efflux RND transporter periplasmic adaptor subunit [Flavicella sediminum]|uniref:efflux RND transporter periplasmic adaptor subunit n=1 Tax=Flavicella sediminum TaxID=2585141 RepID=UPI00111FB3F6|nr:efflux RND transporter periplasmic adaptor subunit [Flavicella sediminum]